MTARLPGWTQRLAWLSLLAFTMLWAARWPTFPLVLDPYYHLFVAQQIVEAGGPMVYEWWEYAPVGRHHLYPPVLHLLLAGCLKMGFSGVFVLRLVSVLIVPLLLGTIYLIMRHLVDEPTALASLWMAMIPFSFPLHAAITLASSLALMELLWLMLAIEQRKVVSAGSLLALLFYTHLGLPWVGLVSGLCYGLLRPAIRPVLLKASWGLALAIPWVMHVAAHHHWLRPTWRYENEILELNVLLYALALVGAIRCWKQAGPARLCLSLWLGFCLFAYRFPYRWLSGEGLLPVILLGGVGMEGLLRWWKARVRRPLFHMGGVAILSLLVLSPTLLLSRLDIRAVWPDTTPFHLVRWPGIKPKLLDTSFYTPQTEQLAHDIMSLSQPGEILWSNAPYAIGLVAALAHRPISSAMVYEVSPALDFDPIGAAHLVVWFKIEPLPGMPALETLLGRYQLVPILDRDVATIYQNRNATMRAREPRAVTSFWLAATLMSGLVAVVIIGFRTRLPGPFLP